MKLTIPLVTFLLLFYCNSLLAQNPNMVPNGSFETNTGCPTGYSQMNLATGWGAYHAGSSDYLNACGGSTVDVPTNTFGNEMAAHGDAYAGGYTFTSPTGTFYKEYITSPITPLTIGATYEVAISVSLADNSGYGADDLGVYFIDNAPATGTGTAVIGVTPQVDYSSYGPITQKNGWVRLTKTFIADSAYERIVIGGFKNSTTIITSATPPGNYCYYYIDSVVIKLATQIFITSVDTVFCQGDVISVPFTITPGYFTTGNSFTLQLSDPSGSFASPTNLATIFSVNAGTLSATLPTTLPPGNGYRVRIFGTTPADTSLKNEKNILIKPKPLVLASANGPICAGGTLNVIATSLPGADYSWTGPNSFTSTQQNNTITNAATTNSGDYIITATLNGCTAKDTVTATVKTMPVVPGASNNGPVCEGTPVTMGATSTTPGVTYSWTGPNGFTSTQQNPTINVTTLADAGNYNVIAALNGCFSPSGSTSITIKPLPAVPTAASNTPVCAGADILLTANSITPGVTYTWSGPNGYSSTLQNPTIISASANDTGDYSATATLNGCTSAAGTTKALVNIVSTIGGWVSPNDTVCEGTLATFVVVTTNEGPNPQLQWYKNGNPITGANSKFMTTSNIATGDSFYCQLIATGVCAVPLVVYSNGIKMYKLPMTVQPSISITSNPVRPLPGNPVEFYANTNNSGYKPIFQWKRNGQDVGGAIHANWSANNLHPYDKISCVVTSSDPCATPKTANSDTIVVNFPTSVGSTALANECILYPNPNNGSFTVKGTANSSVLQLSISNAIGQVVYKDAVHPQGNTFEYHISNNLVPGVYMLRIDDNDQRMTFNFTVYK